MWFGLAGALALMVGKILKGVERTSGGEIQAAARAEKAGSAALGAFTHQCGPVIGQGGMSAKWISCENSTLVYLSS